MGVNLQQSRYIAGNGAVAVLVGCVGPWAKVLSGFGSISIAGFDTDDGKIVAAAAVVAGLIGVFATRRLAAVIAGLAGAGVAMLSIYEAFRLSDWATEANASGEVRASIGWGLYLCIVGGLAVVFGAVAAWNFFDDQIPEPPALWVPTVVKRPPAPRAAAPVPKAAPIPPPPPSAWPMPPGPKSTDPSA